VITTAKQPRSAPAGVRSRDYISFSEIATYRGCPLRHHFRYVMGLPETTVSASLVFGRAIHQAVEHHFNELLAGNEPPTLDALLAEYDRAWSEVDTNQVTFGKDDDVERLGKPTSYIALVVLVNVAIGSLFVFSTPLRIAGLIAPLGIYLWLKQSSSSMAQQLPAILLNWRVLGVIVAFVAPDIRHVMQWDVATLALPFALAASASFWIWSTWAPSQAGQDWATSIDLPRAQRRDFASVSR
jgi:hypothetical protein